MENRFKERLNSLINEIQTLEGKVDQTFAEAQRLLHYEIIKRKVKFEKETLKAHRALKQSLYRYVLTGDLLMYLTSPFIYSMIIPAVILDLFVSVYQRVCFPVYGIPKVHRREYIAIDRHKLGYLNALEKLNCIYCGYFNGLIAYVREIAGRTEQYWCPIRHARSVKGRHAHYGRFSAYGDGEGYQAQLASLRKELARLEDEEATAD